MKRIYLIPFLFLLIFLYSCSSQNNPSLNKKEDPKRDYKEASPITILILPTQSPGDIYERFLPLKYYLEDKIKRPILLKISRSYEDAITDIEKGSVHMAFLDPMTYCEIRAKYKNRLIPLVKPIGTNGSTERSVLVVKDNSNIDKVADLKGKRLALGNTRSSFSYLVPLSMIRDVNLSLNDFVRVDFLEKEDRVALSVLVGYHDVGAISKGIAKKYLSDGLKIIKESEAINSFVFCASNVLSKEIRDEILNALILLKDKEILSKLDPEIDSLVTADDRDFDIVRIMIKNLTGRDYIEYGPKTIKVAILPLYSAITLYNRYDPLMRYLSKKTGYEFKLLIPKDFDDFMNIVKRRDVDFSYQNPYIFALIDKETDIKPLVTTIDKDNEGGRDEFRGVIITRQDSPIRGARDLRNKRVLITSFKSAGGFLSQHLYLKQMGIDTQRDMKLIDAKRQENVIIGVYRGEADAGFVRESALTVAKDIVDMNMIRVIVKTTPLPNWPFAAVREIESPLSKEVKRILIELNDRDILNSANIKGFKKADESEFEMLKQY